MKKSKDSKKDDELVDLAAEQLAELFIEQARQKYNKVNKQTVNEDTYIEQIKINLRYSWEPVLVENNKEYYFPMKVSAHMRKNYNKPAIYRWNIFEEHPDDKKQLYIGETVKFCPRRLRGYLNPGPTQYTNIRMNELFHKLTDEGLKVRLEILNLQNSSMGKIPIVEEDLSDKYVRHYIEHILIVHYQNKGYDLLNL